MPEKHYSEWQTNYSPDERTVPEERFVVRTDELLLKHLPDKSIPWQAGLPPLWARGFTPRTLFDLGCGIGGFTRAVLTRLGEWGCLRHLEQVVLVERDTTLFSGGADALHSHLTETVAAVLASFGKDNARIHVLLENMEITTSGRSHASGFIPILEPWRGNSDLIIASHITYYFGDGSGHGLIDLLRRYYLSTGGLIWCVIRKQCCPIYLARADVLRELGKQDPKPFDYAEHFESSVLPTLPEVILTDKSDQEFLIGKKRGEYEEAAYYLMWREAPAGNWSTPHAKAVMGLSNQPEPLFCERHFIIGKEHAK
uniref:Methyltransferase domain-containing protein n=1 Tax=Candidatus Kentrum sp. DK TaxID=2126562 RepID=A0A450SR75_9GAMM|nr:MAG: hypothetical protein BECKDK2373B_GA0170837_105915 [Candidatus Kentron sp. DK]